MTRSVLDGWVRLVDGLVGRAVLRVVGLALAGHTARPTARDVVAFVAWAERLGLTAPAEVDRQVVRRYLAHLGTLGRSPRTIARRLSALRRWFGWLRRRAWSTADPTAGLSAPRGEARLPRVLRADELHQLLDEPPAAATTDPVARRPRRRRARAPLRQRPPGGGALRPAASATSTSPGAVVTVWGKGSKQRRVPLSAPAVAAVRRLARRACRDRLADARRRRPAVPQPAGRTRSRPATCAASSTAVRRRRRTPTPCATPSPRTCSTAAPTSASCRSCSATPT